MDKLLGVISEEEKNEVMMVDMMLSCLNELKLSFQTIYLTDEEERVLLSNYGAELKYVQGKKTQWWESICKNYHWDAKEFSSWLLKYDSNEVIVELI